MVSPKVPFALTEANKTISTVASLSFKIKPKSHRKNESQNEQWSNSNLVVSTIKPKSKNVNWKISQQKIAGF